MSRTLLALCSLSVALALAGTGDARAANIKLLTTGAFRPAAQDIVGAFERASGNKVTIVNDTAGAIVQRLKSNEAFDVLVLTDDAMDQLADLGVVSQESVVPLAKVGIGMGVGLGAPQPNIVSVEGFRRTLLDAHAIAYLDPSTGATSGKYLRLLMQKLGIASQIESKTILVRSGLAAQSVARGDADVALQQASEIKLVGGVKFAGLIPNAIQNWTTYAGAISANSHEKDAALALLSALSDPGAEPILKRRGLDLP